MKAIILAGFAGVLAAQQPPGGAVNFYSFEKEAALGAEFTAGFQRAIPTSPDTSVDSIGARIAVNTTQSRCAFYSYQGNGVGVDGLPPAALPGDWQRLDIEEAIAVPGCTVFLPRRLLTRDDSQLAAILAHALAHIELRHATRLMTRRELAKIAVRGAARPDVPPFPVDLSTAQLYRSFEREADFHAVQLLRRAGFDPVALVNFLRTLPGQEPSVMSVYPTPASRIQSANRAIELTAR
jgi:hypothetical protein